MYKKGWYGQLRSTVVAFDWPDILLYLDLFQSKYGKENICISYWPGFG